MPSLHEDFWTYCSCYEIPQNHAVWSAIGMMAGTVNRKVYIMHGDLKFHCGMYITLISDQGGGKSTAKDFCEEIFRAVSPEYPIGPHQQSREDIVKFMSSDECMNTYVDHLGQQQELRIYCFFIDELKNFVSYNAAGMLAFLTNIYGVRNQFDASTIKRGLEKIINPCLNILACENPDWIITNLKSNIISGGFSRRMLFVYEIGEPPPRPEIIITPQARTAIQTVAKRLARMKASVGEFVWTTEARAFWNKWYIDHRSNLSEDPIFRGYQKDKHVKLLKVAMLLGLSQEEVPDYQLTLRLLEQSLSILDGIEKNMPRLSIASGRNELAEPMQRMLEIIRTYKMKVNGSEITGIIPKKKLMQLMDKHLTPFEQSNVFQHLRSSEQIVIEAKVDNGVLREFVFTKDAAFLTGVNPSLVSK